MIKVIGVRFRTAGKIYFFDPCQFEIKKGDHVIVETARGIEYGTVMNGVREVDETKVIQPLKPVLRLATERDTEQEKANKEKEKEAFKICLEKIRKHELEMKLIDVEYTFDNNKVLFYFTADGRIDFRELVKDLAAVFKTRIELRQIGVRDETKLMGGIGICGRPLCCHSYLSDFVPVSIKMAKDQNLSLNPAKISGVCGRLMCCLKNEDDTYQELNRHLPGIGDTVTTAEGETGEVSSVNVLRQIVKVIVEENGEKEVKEFPADTLTFKKRHGKKEKLELSKEELKELEKLEREEKQEEQENTENRKNGENYRQDKKANFNRNRDRKIQDGKESQELSDTSRAQKTQPKGESAKEGEFKQEAAVAANVTPIVAQNSGQKAAGVVQGTKEMADDVEAANKEESDFDSKQYFDEDKLGENENVRGREKFHNRKDKRRYSDNRSKGFDKNEQDKDAHKDERNTGKHGHKPYKQRENFVENAGEKNTEKVGRDKVNQDHAGGDKSDRENTSFAGTNKDHNRNHNRNYNRNHRNRPYRQGNGERKEDSDGSKS